MSAFLVWLVSTPASADLPIDNIEALGFNGVDPAHQMDIEIVGGMAYSSVGLGGGLETYDISDPENPAYVTASGNPNWRSRAYGNTLYAFGRDRGIDIYDISENTTLLSTVPAGGRFYEGGALYENNLYVAAHDDGIVTVNVTNPYSPIVTGTYELENSACWNVESVGNFLLVANGHHGFSVVLVGEELSEVATINLPGLANDIVLDGQVAVVSLGASGIATIDVTIPHNPALLDIHPSMGNAWGMGISDHKVAVGSWRVLEVFDVSDPQNIELIGWENTRTWAMGADIQDFGAYDVIAVADWEGITTYRLGSDPGPDIDVYPQRLDFGATSGADTVVTIKNTGTTALEIEYVDTPPGIEAIPVSFSVNPGESYDLTLHATGTAVYGYITYNSNDPDESAFRQYVYANNNGFPQVGSVAPDFTLQGTDGNTYTLSDLRGNVIYLEFGGGW
jgi:hypothetical protein